MAEATTTQAEEEKKDPTELSIGNIVAWAVGGFVLLGGVASLAQGGAVGTAIIFIVAGIFGLPPTRRMIEDELNVKFSRWLSVLIFLVLLILAGSLA